MEVNIGEILEGLKYGKAPRTQQSLENINSILQHYYESGKRDFSITTIARLSKASGGIGYHSINSAKNSAYKDLIKAWAAKAGTDTNKPKKERRSPTDDAILARITDPALRAYIGGILRKVRRLTAENNMLKSKSNVVIDMRPSPKNVKKPLEIFPPICELIDDEELAALRYAISDQCMAKQDWTVMDHGRVTDDENFDVFPRGFVTGLRKIISDE
tara:strand:- start:337 stop:984 length:648 start_codon:yes stop_codon:yes gene_type:complete